MSPAAISLLLAITARFLSNIRMAEHTPSLVPLGEGPADAAMQHVHWRKRWQLSSIGERIETFLASAGFDRGPWLAVAFAAGIALWFVLPRPAEWVAAIAAGLIVAIGSVA